MNPNTNDLIDHDQIRRDFEGLKSAGVDDALDDQIARLKELTTAMEAAKDPDIEPLPEKFHHAARCALQGKSHVVVSRQSKGKLSKYAAGRRRQLGRQPHRG